MNNIYDVIIIGGGVIGCSIARYLSRFNGNFLVIERHNDVGDETSSANSAIVHSGYDPKPGSLKAKFNVLGCKMMKELCEQLDVHYINNGSLTVALNDEDYKLLIELKERAKINGVDAQLLSKEETIKLEPNINQNILGSLYCKDAGIVDPFNLTVGLMENAMNNGCNLLLNTEICKIEKEKDIYVLTDKKNNKYFCKVLVNATGVNSELVTSYLETPNFKIYPTKGEYILLNHFDDNFVKHTLFMCPSKVGKGVLVAPTSSLNYIVGPSADLTDKDDTSCSSSTMSFLKEKAKNLVENVPYVHTVKCFAGVRANNDHNDFIIEESLLNKNFIKVCGIMSPGLASSPAIGDYVSTLIKEKLNLEVNEKFNPNNKKHYSVKYMNVADYDNIVKNNPLYGKFICRCERVSEGEIVDCIHRNCGATTLKGVKKRVRSGFGKCQGGYCQNYVVKILSRELKKDMLDVLYNELGTNILVCDSKEAK